MLSALVGAIADAPADLSPLDTLFRAFRAFEPMLEDDWSYSKPRQEVIAATPALRERELAKVAALADALALALQERGVGRLRAVLAAQIGMAAFVDVTLSWLDDPTIGYVKRIDLALGELRTILTEHSDRQGNA